MAEAFGLGLQQPKQTPAFRVMTTSLVTSRPHTDQERVVHLALEHHLQAVPVVDKEGRFLGAVLRRPSCKPFTGKRAKI